MHNGNWNSLVSKMLAIIIIRLKTRNARKTPHNSDGRNRRVMFRNSLCSFGCPVFLLHVFIIDLRMNRFDSFFSFRSADRQSHSLILATERTSNMYQIFNTSVNTKRHNFRRHFIRTSFSLEMKLKFLPRKEVDHSSSSQSFAHSSRGMQGLPVSLGFRT